MNTKHPVTVDDEGPPRIALTGATGYVGGRLLPLLEQSGVRVRCITRHPAHLERRIDVGTESVYGDLLQPETLPDALRGVDTAYYLVHSMGGSGDFEDTDRVAARHFAEAAREAGVRRIIYLGGLCDEQSALSKHLRSRLETGKMLRTSGAEVIEFRASIIIGSGSLSFELIRALVRKLPVMICPRWVRTPAQPIAIEDVLAYLLAAVDLPRGESRVFEIGGPERSSYLQVMQEYARQRKLRRWMIPVPILTPNLSSLWLGLVTPIYADVGRELIEGVRNPSVVSDATALDVFEIRPRSVPEAIERALANEDHEFALTRWSDAISSREPRRWGGEEFGSRLIDSRAIDDPVSPEKAFEPIQRLGGKTGWYYGNALWRLRGFLDLLVGGAGLRRGRRDPLRLAVGDTLDCWRVEQIDPPEKLLLRAEMKLPGRAWLEYEVQPHPEGATIRQTAIFDPSGLSGLAYWYGIWPLHQLVFRGMLRGVAKAATQPVAETPDPSGAAPVDAVR